MREAAFNLLQPKAATQAADSAAVSVNFAAGLSVLAACICAGICCAWAVWERARAGAFRRFHDGQRIRLHMANRLRDMVIASGGDAVQVDGPNLDGPLNFGDAESLAGACTRGPDAVAFAAARKGLRENGAPFEIEIRTAGDEIIAARGRPIAGHAVLFLRSLQPPTDIPTKQEEIDRRHTLNALAPAANSAQQDQVDAFGATLNRLTDAVAIFGPDHRLSFCNRAYAQLWDLPRAWLDTCPALSLILDRLRETGRLPEQHDFGAWKTIQLAAFGSPELCSEELWHLPSGRSLRVVWQPHPSGGLTVLFQDITDRLTSESVLKVQYKVQRATLEMFPEAAAIFGPDGRLRLCNSAFLRLWHLGEDAVSGNPHMGRVAAHCRQHFGEDGIWSLVSESINAAGSKEKPEAIEVTRSDGRVLSIVLARLPDGATLAGFHDVSDLRRLQAALRETAA